ncbi:MAG: hypothetical protein KGM95_07260 [Betaproteobacteria bacterium]|nr:hypothetical protein [Betaproteobacteria bacterium]
MENAEFNLLMALALIPAVFWLQVWVRKRRHQRRNESGQQEFDSLGATLLSAVMEGGAVVFSLILIIWIMGGVLRYFFPMIFNAR